MMNKITMLQNPSVIRRVFTSSALERLSAMAGELAVPSEPLGETPEAAEHFIRNADVVITSWASPALSQNLLDLAPNLKLVLHAAGSVKPIITDALWERRIPVISAASVLSRGVAETALGLTIMTLKNVWEVTAQTRAGNWWNNRADEVREHIREMYGVTIGVIGAGQAGRHYMELLRHFRVNILLYDPTVSVQEAAALGAQSVSLEQLMESSDVVMVLAPEIPQTYHMINEERLFMMKDDAVLINLARGSLVDEDALGKRLESGKLKVILDVTEPEPPPADHWLRKHPNVMLTGHIAGAVNNGLLSIGDFTVDELQRFYAGERLIGEIDPTRLHMLA
ncbi:hydroxyacid dehydrogenase [Paenibacillus abyssi]